LSAILNLENLLATQKQFRALLLGIVRAGDRVSNGALVRKDFVIIATHKGLVTKEMNSVVISRVNKVETVRLVPTSGKAIETDLSANRVRQVQIGKLLLHFGHHGFANLVLQIEFLVIVALFATAVAPNGGNVEHAAAEFKERAALE